MSFESFPNEILLDLFECFSLVQLLHSFYGLNHRLQTLLLDHMDVRALDLRSVSKHDLDTLCQQYLPSIAHRIAGLYLSDGENTQQTVRFAAQGLTLRQFTRLRTFHLHEVASMTTTNKMVSDCRHLTHLTLDHCHFSCNQTDVDNVVNIIWSLPNLLYCYLDIETNDSDIEFPSPKIHSASLKYLTILNMDCRLEEFASLVEYTPHLRHLCASFTSNDDSRIYPASVSSITHFSTDLRATDHDRIVNILVHMPALHSLTVETVNDMGVDGRQWEQIIRDHGIHLKRFRLKLTRKLKNNRNWQQHVNELMDSFRSRFWLEERRWFVQCDWDPDAVAVYLYTLPYAFDRLVAHFPLEYKSTRSHDQCCCSYTRVRRLKYTSSPAESLDSGHVRFSNLQHLTVYLPLDDQFWTVISDFNRLTSLCVAWYNYNEQFPGQLQSLLDRAPHLYSLSIETWRSSTIRMAPADIIHSAVRRLDFYNYHYHYSSEDCATLSRSPLGLQCEVLRVAVENRTCVLDLVHTMPNLCHLIVQCRDDNYTEQSTPTTTTTTTRDELIEWLDEQLASLCTLIRCTRFGGEIHLWIR